MLGKITDNIEGKFDNQQTSKLDTTCVTGQTDLPECIRKIKENYQGLVQPMRDSLEKRLYFETKWQIVDCKKDN